MFSSYFGFRNEPFKLTSDPQFLYINPTYQRAYDSLLSGVRERKALTVLVGEAGTGKTTLLRKLAQTLEATDGGVFIPFHPKLSFDNLLESCCDVAGIAQDAEDRASRTAALTDFLITRWDNGGIAALLVDEAENLDQEMLESLDALFALKKGNCQLLPIVLAGQPEFELMLDQTKLLSNTQESVARSRLDRLEKHEVALFIDHQLRAAGYHGRDLFSPAAIERVAQYSNGLPWLVNMVCSTALLITEFESSKTVSVETIEQAIRGNTPFAGLEELTASQTLPENTMETSDEEGTNLPNATSSTIERVVAAGQPSRPDAEHGPLLAVESPAESPSASSPEGQGMTQPEAARSPWFRKPTQIAASLVAGLVIGGAVAFYYQSRTLTLDDSSNTTIFPSEAAKARPDTIETDEAAPPGPLPAAKNADVVKKTGPRVDPDSDSDSATTTTTPPRDAFTNAEAYDELEKLLAKGADVNAQNGRGKTALIEAAESGHSKALQLLIAHRATVNVADNSGETALMYATWNGHISIVRELLDKGADVNTQNRDGWTALINAAVNGHTGIVEALLEAGANVNARSHDGKTALMAAAWNGHTDIVQALLGSGSDVNAKDVDDWTALIYAVWNNHARIVQVLVDTDADLSVKNNERQTAFMVAESQGYDEIAKILEEAKTRN